jgi:hypothetical protein
MDRLTFLAAGALVLAGGCYSVEPIASAKPVAGTHVQMSINDDGRVALGGSMGPEIRRVEGNLLAQDGNEYVVSVSGVNYLNGIFQPWKGETVRIDTKMVSGLYEKKFSKGRTIAFAVAATAVGVALRPRMVQSSFPDPDSLPPGSQSSRRPVTLIRIGLPR